MADIAFIGLGRVGSLALRIFTQELGGGGYRIRCIDAADRSAAAARVGAEFVRASTPREIAGSLGGAFLACVALPSSVAFPVVAEVIRRGISVVDVSFTREDPYSLAPDTLRNNVFYVPDAGFAPGYSNLVAGFFQEKLGGAVDELMIYVGGIPVEPIPPIGYVVTWNPMDLLEEYTRPARIVVDGRIAFVDPLSTTHMVEVEGVGVFEGFYSDGLRTMLRNIRAGRMAEVTIRHPGHIQAMRILRSLGFLDDKPIVVNGVSVEPRRVTARLFEEKLSMKARDIAVLKVVARRGSRRLVHISYTMGGDGDPPATALFTALVYAKTIEATARRGLEPGVHPLETLPSMKGEYDGFISSRVRVREWEEPRGSRG